MIWPFSRNKQTALEKLSGGEWQCSSCDAAHKGMFDLAAFAPDPWPHHIELENNWDLRFDGDFLSEDFCVLDGKHFFVRCVLPIPVHGLEHDFGFGCWGSLKPENLDYYIDHFDSGTVPPEAPFFSWLCNSLKPFNLKEPLACKMVPREGRQRPYLYPHDPDHPVAIAQSEGISPEEVLRYYETNGHRAA